MSKKLKRSEWQKVFEGIVEAYNENNPSWKLDGEDYCEIFEGLELDGFEILDDNSGHEDHGKDCHTVFSWKGKTYKAEYQYYSYVGTEYDSMEVYEVQAKQVLITVWE